MSLFFTVLMYALILQVQAKISTEWPMFPGYDYDKTSQFSDYDSNPTGTGGLEGILKKKT